MKRFYLIFSIITLLASAVFAEGQMEGDMVGNLILSESENSWKNLSEEARNALHKKISSTATFAALKLTTDDQKSEYFNLPSNTYSFWTSSGVNASTPKAFLQGIEALNNEAVKFYFQMGNTYGVDYAEYFMKIHNYKLWEVGRRYTALRIYWGDWQSLIK